jgi:hypothetical protein
VLGAGLLLLLHQLCHTLPAQALLQAWWQWRQLRSCVLLRPRLSEAGCLQQQLLRCLTQQRLVLLRSSKPKRAAQALQQLLD